MLAGCSGDGAPTTTRGPAPAAETADVGARAYDLQGHRGARGLRPENTLPSFEVALDLLVDTLELDLHLSADDIVVVWHDPVVRAASCDVATPLPIRETTAADLRSLRCDRNPDPDRFPAQVAEPGVVAGDDYGLVSLEDVFVFVVQYAASAEKSDAQRRNAATVRFNVETKRDPGNPAAIGDGFDGSSPGTFERALIETAQRNDVLDRLIVQSFDHRSLWAIAAAHPDVLLAALTRRNDAPDPVELVTKGADIWSPDHRGLTVEQIEAAHRAGLLVVPWTVNDLGEIQRLLDLGVDGLITDRPDFAAGLR